MFEILNEEYGVQMDAWLDVREAELAPLVQAYAGMGGAIFADMQRQAVRREFSRTSPELHRGFYSLNPARHTCFANVKRGRILKRSPEKLAGWFEYLFDGQDCLLGAILHPGEGGLLTFCSILNGEDGCVYDLDYTQSVHGCGLNHIWRYEMDGDRIISELLLDACMGKASKLCYFHHHADGCLEALWFDHLLLTRYGKGKIKGSTAGLLPGIPGNIHRRFIRFHMVQDISGEYRWS